MTRKTEVLYNASCPVCSREIDHYERLSQTQALAIQYDDLGDDQRLAEWGLNADEAAKRLHVRKDGQLYAGIPAFIVLWQEIPQMGWLARIVSLPGIHWLACTVYDNLLAPSLYRWHLRREKRNGA
jgi:predicted DCC family thiol-disulfide oxidoreductase YuxK